MIAEVNHEFNCTEVKSEKYKKRIFMCGVVL